MCVEIRDTELLPIGIIPRKTHQKKYKRSYAAVLSASVLTKKKPKSNHVAYKAWQERRGQRKPTKEIVATAATMDRQQSEAESYTLVSYGKKK